MPNAATASKTASGIFASSALPSSARHGGRRDEREARHGPSPPERGHERRREEEPLGQAVEHEREAEAGAHRLAVLAGGGGDREAGAVAERVHDEGGQHDRGADALAGVVRAAVGEPEEPVAERDQRERAGADGLDHVRHEVQEQQRGHDAEGEPVDRGRGQLAPAPPRHQQRAHGEPQERQEEHRPEHGERSAPAAAKSQPGCS